MILTNNDVLEEVIHEIMDDMFFLFPELDEEGLPMQYKELNPPYLDAGIHFNTEDLLRIRIDYGLLTEMASNFTGLPPESIEQEHLESTAAETANIIGGNFLVKIDPEQNYKLSIPELLEANQALAVADRPWQLSFISENGGLLCWPEPLKKS